MLVKDVILQAHLTTFYLCGYENHSLVLQAQSQLSLKNLFVMSMLDASSNKRRLTPRVHLVRFQIH
jgi:hypothetical protein